MSGKPFFTARYERLGWKYREVKLKQSIRINCFNASEADVIKRLEARGVELEKIHFLDRGYWVENSAFSVGAIAEYLLGLYSIQEAAAQIPVTLFTNLEDKIVLDACAAPGGKTVQLADLMRNTGAIIALDNDRKRLTALGNHLERCRAENAIVYSMDACAASKLNLTFDRILLDVPCSGNFASDPEWFKNRTTEDIKRNAILQREILTEAVKLLAEDGELVYSTCSLEPEEDEMNVDWAIRNLDLQVEKVNCYGEEGLTNIFGHRLDESVARSRRIWPGLTQGFFVCKFKLVKA